MLAEKLRQPDTQGREFFRPPPFIRQVVAVVARATQALRGEAFAVLQQLLALAGDAARTFFGFTRHPDAREGFGVAGDVTVEARHEGERSAPVGLHLLAVFVPIARPHHEALDAERH